MVAAVRGAEKFVGEKSIGKKKEERKPISRHAYERSVSKEEKENPIIGRCFTEETGSTYSWQSNGRKGGKDQEENPIRRKGGPKLAGREEGRGEIRKTEKRKETTKCPI